MTDNDLSNASAGQGVDLRAISAILLKIAGLVLVAHAVTRVPSLFAYGTRADWGIRELLTLAGLGIGPQLLLGAIFWFFPGTITNKIVAGTLSSSKADFREIQLIALAVLGVYLMAQSLIELAQAVATATALSRYNPDASLAPLVPRSLGAAAGLALGFAICLGRAGISAQIDRMRGRDGQP